MLAIIILSAIFYLLWLGFKPFDKYALYFGLIAWLLHAVLCFYSIFDENGWKLHIINAVLLVSWLSVLVVLLFRLRSKWVKIPLVVFIFYTYLLLDFNPILSYHYYKKFSWQLDLHISLSMLAYAILSVASLYAISLYVHIIKLKNNTIETGNSLISVMEEEKKLFYLIFLGWLILTTSLLSGVIFVENFIQQHLGHKVIFSILAWLVFGLLSFGRMMRGWRGEKLILLTIIGMMLLATGYLGSKIVLEWVI